jgi:trans-2,3-dihydro-3-hydroxyanthranilate isomerase
LKLPYLLLDVFTRERFAGNQLAVVPNADRLLDGQMQSIANEFNFSETVFLCKPDSDLNTAKARIFTPLNEMPFAGHPTIGAVVALGLRSKASVIRLEEGIGVVTALFEKTGLSDGLARFALPQLPERVGQVGSTSQVALALGIDRDEVGLGAMHPAIFTAGNIFHLVPVRDKGVLGRISLNEGAWRSAFPEGRHSAYVFTQVVDEPGVHFAARKLTPGMHEDPGTGSAVGALMGLLAENDDFATTQLDYVVRQGYEIGRPCQISMQFRSDGTRLVHGTIGGHAVIVGEGTLDLGEAS